MEKKLNNTITIGLFGTCGTSTWRDKFIQEYDNRHITYFNPNVFDWQPSYAEIEAEHLVEDEIILFPVTDETYGTGSLAEIGFAINQAIKSNTERFVVIYVAPKVTDKLIEQNSVLAKDSDRTRSLVLAHLKKQSSKYPNVYITSSLDDMYEVSLALYNSMVKLKEARKYCI